MSNLVQLAQRARAELPALRRLTCGLEIMARRGRSETLLYMCMGIGDDLLCTAVLHELRRRGAAGRLGMMTNYPGMFAGNPDVDILMPYGTVLRRLNQALKVRVLHLDYSPPVYAEDRQPAPERHIISCMCQLAGLSGPITLRPYLTLQDAEKEAGRRVPRQVVIQSAGNATSAQTKEWYPERFQAVVTALKGDFNFVQLGAKGDPPLEGALDLRGKTSLRESAAILSASVLLVGQVGFLMHLARAVDCRSVVVYGGREAPWQSGYPCNENLYTQTPYSPCWRWNHCECGRECMNQISVEAVVAAVERLARRHGQPLEIDTDVIP